MLQEYAMPRLYNLTNDPGETDNVLFLHAWFPKAALPQLEEYFVSLKQYPPIFASQKDPYKLPKYP